MQQGEWKVEGQSEENREVQERIIYFEEENEREEKEEGKRVKGRK